MLHSQSIGEMLQRFEMCNANSVLDGIMQRVRYNEKFVLDFALSDMCNKMVQMTMKL